MTDDEPESTDGQLESMLRRWGAEEAARRELPSRPPLPVPQTPVSAPWGPWRWLAAAAVVVTTAAATGLVTAYIVRARLGRGPVLATTAPSQDQHRKLQEALQTARDQLAKLRRRAATQDEQLEQLRSKLRDQQTALAALRDDLAAQKKLAASAVAEKDRLAGEVDRLGKELARRRQEAQKATAELTRTKEALAAAQARSRDLNDQLAAQRKRVAAANAELTRLGKTHQRTLTEKRKLENDLTAMKARQAALESRLSTLMASLRRSEPESHLLALRSTGGTLIGFHRPGAAQLPSAPSGPSPAARVDWAARQSAARKADMLVRCARLRRDVHDPDTARLIERLEVLLTRLELLDPNDPHAVRAFAIMVRADRLAKQIEAALAGEGLSRELRDWLAEARTILTGAERAR